MRKQGLRKFLGADNIYLTSKSIAVSTVKCRVTPEGVRYRTVTKYYPRTAENMRAATSIYGRLPSRGRK